MTGFTSLLGMPMGAPSTAVWLATASTAAALAGVPALPGGLVSSPFGRMLVAVRDDEARLRFLGYDPVWPKLAAWTLSGVLAAIAGALYVPQVGINQSALAVAGTVPSRSRSGSPLGGRGTLSGAVIGAAVISALKFWLTGFAPDLWPLIHRRCWSLFVWWSTCRTVSPISVSRALSLCKEGPRRHEP